MDYKDARPYLGDRLQLFGIKPYTLTGARAQDIKAVDVKTGAGLQFTVLQSKCMDISELSFKGINLAFLSKTGLVHPSYYREDGVHGFLQGFSAGMLTTCGLTYMGAPCEDEGRPLGLHGPIHNTPADEFCASVEEGELPQIVLSGKMREAEVFSQNLSLNRTIRCAYGENKLYITDTAVNQGFTEQPLMLLYHVNFGFPLLSEQARIHIPHTSVEARDAAALPGLPNIAACEPPLPGRPEQCYFYEAKADSDGFVSCFVENLSLGIRLTLSYKQDTLPYLTQWKSMACGDYALGIEPGTYTPMGRAHAKEQGKLTTLKPGEQRSFTLSLHAEEI